MYFRISVLLFNDSGTCPNRRNATPQHDLPHSRQPEETAPAPAIHALNRHLEQLGTQALLRSPRGFP